MQGYLREGDVLFVDNGTSYALFGLKFPPKCTFVGSFNSGSIGYSVGALLGTLTAGPVIGVYLFFLSGCCSSMRHFMLRCVSPSWLSLRSKE